MSGLNRRGLTAAALLAVTTAAASAHEISASRPGPRSPDELWRTWGTEPGTWLLLIASALLYTRGAARLWRATRAGGGIRRLDAACFAAGWFTLAVALVSPLHPLGSMLFAAHMTQHELLMLVAAPLLILGRPLVAFLRALPRGTARRLAGWARAPGLRQTGALLANPFAAWLIHAAVLWMWHIPALFQATLESEWVHAAQHASFLGSALLFWQAVIHGRQRRMGYGAAVLYMFTTALHSGLLGTLLTLAQTIWYPAYAETTFDWGLTPLEDQQLGGLIMWVPAGLVYVIAGLALFAGWLRESENRALRQSAATRPAEAALPE